MEGFADRFIATLGLSDGDLEVRDITAMLQAALELSRQTNHAAPLRDALEFAHGRLRVRGLTQVDCIEVGAALETAASPSLRADERVRLHALVAHGDWGSSTTAAPDGLVAGTASAAYVEHLVRGQRQAALALTRRCAAEGMSIEDILLDVLEPALREVGRQWALGMISVAHEHFCTAVTQFAMTDLYPALFTGDESRRRLVAVQVPGSNHHVGLRMVVDVLECRDWSTTYLLDDVTVESLPALVAENQADLLLISASMPSQLAALTAMIRAVHDDARTRDVKIVVGGRPFLVAPDLVESVGADGWAPDARSAVDVCDALVGGDRARP